VQGGVLTWRMFWSRFEDHRSRPGSQHPSEVVRAAPKRPPPLRSRHAQL